MREDVCRLKYSAMKVYKPHCDGGIFTLKFGRMDNLHEDVMRYSSLDVIGVAPFEHLNVYTKQSYSGTSEIHASRMDETFHITTTIVNAFRASFLANPSGQRNKKR